MTTIYLNNNRIQVIKRNFFKNLQALVTLDLKQNQISMIEQTSVQGLCNLNWLQITIYCECTSAFLEWYKLQFFQLIENWSYTCIDTSNTCETKSSNDNTQKPTDDNGNVGMIVGIVLSLIFLAVLIFIITIYRKTIRTRLGARTKQTRRSYSQNIESQIGNFINIETENELLGQDTGTQHITSIPPVLHVSRSIHQMSPTHTSGRIFTSRPIQHGETIVFRTTGSGQIEFGLLNINPDSIQNLCVLEESGHYIYLYKITDSNFERNIHIFCSVNGSEITCKTDFQTYTVYTEHSESIWITAHICFGSSVVELEGSSITLHEKTSDNIVLANNNLQARFSVATPSVLRVSDDHEVVNNIQTNFTEILYSLEPLSLADQLLQEEIINFEIYDQIKDNPSRGKRELLLTLIKRKIKKNVLVKVLKASNQTHILEVLFPNETFSNV